MSAAKLLSDALAARARPARREYTLADAQLPGFGLRVRPEGTKSWVLRAALDGARRRVTLGDAADMGATEARACAHALLAAQGPSPQTAAQAGPEPSRRSGPRLGAAAAAPTFAALADAFLEAKAEVWRPSSLVALRAYLRNQLLPAFGALRVDRIAPPDVATWFHGYGRTRPGGANQALGHFRAIVNWGRETGRLPEALRDPSSPVRRMPRRARGVLLTTAQIEALGRALDRPLPVDRDAADAVRLILLTGCRSGEILRLPWSGVRPDRLLLAQTKTGPREVLLTRPAAELLKRRRRRADGPWVFPSATDAARPVACLSASWARLRAQAGLAPTTRLHDLRHTYASQAVMRGETLAMAGQLLGHRRTASTERYAHLDGTYLVAAAERCAARIAALLG